MSGTRLAMSMTAASVRCAGGNQVRGSVGAGYSSQLIDSQLVKTIA